MASSGGAARRLRKRWSAHGLRHGPPAPQLGEMKRLSADRVDMEPADLATAVENLDRRLGRVEQILPTLATKEDLADAVATLATKDELREEGERSRTHMDVLFERLEAKIQVFAEGHAALEERDARQHAETLQALTAVDKRVMALEAARPRRGRG